MKLSSINPTTGELIESFEEISDADLEAALQRARQTFRTYRSTSFAERAAWLQKAAQILESESDTWARLMTREMGKTYKAALAEAQKCASGCRYFAEPAIWNCPPRPSCFSPKTHWGLGSRANSLDFCPLRCPRPLPA